MKVLVVSTTVEIRETMAAYRQRGLLPEHEYVYLIEYFADPLPPEEPGALYPLKDFARVEEVAALLSLLPRDLEAVISVDEFSVYVAAQAREVLGLPGMTSEVALRFRDKLTMKEAVRAAGLRVAARIPAGRLQSGDFSFPLVLKPRSLAGAVGVEIVRDHLELEKFLADSVFPGDAAYRDMDENQYFCEEFVAGPIWHMDGCVRAGELGFWTLARYRNTPLDFLGGRPIGSVIVPHEQVPQAWVRELESLLDALGGPDGVYHVELIGELHERPVLLEIGYRPGGGYVKEAIAERHGIDLQLAHLRLQLALPVAMPAMTGASTVGWLAFPKEYDAPAPRVVEHAFLPEAKLRSRVVHVAIPQPGAPASGEFYHHRDCLGSFMLEGRAEDVEADLTWIEQSYELSTKPLCPH